MIECVPKRASGRLSLLAAGAMSLALSQPLHAAMRPLQVAPDGRPLVLTFADDFSRFRPYGEPDGIWRTTFGDGSQRGLDRRNLPANGELEIYVDRNLSDGAGKIGLDPFRTRDGHLEIAAWPTPPALVSRLGDHPYVSGLISSQPSFSQLHGYFEMRAKIPGGKGLWPAFWLLPADGSWPPEIDVMESVGDPTRVYATAHSNLVPPVDIEGHVTPDQFHTYAVSWDRAKLNFYVDGSPIGEEKTPADLTKPMYMLANLAVGGNWPGTPDGTTPFPATLTVSFIRAYRFAQ